ncbi:MAG: ribonuclease Y [Gemmatimonadetes bacterium]|nr:ribonuclease Y [Gemmatimonadota bacterium]
MNTALVTLLAASAAGVLAFLVGRSLERARQRRARETAGEEAQRIREAAARDAEAIRQAAELKGREEAYKAREAWTQEEARRRDEMQQVERRLVERAESLDRKAEALDRKLSLLDQRDSAQEKRQAESEEASRKLEARVREVEELGRKRVEELEKLAGVTAQEAKRQIVDELKDEARAQAANTIRRIREEAQRNAEREARKVVALAIQRIASDQTAEMTVSVVTLPSDELKGRIIGREGRNIRAFEQATGVDVIIDDTPEAVILSSFDPVRREVARLALEKLVADGRIHPGRIEDVVAKARKEVDQGMIEAAESLLYELGIHNVHPEVIKVLGRLKFRTSYGQNQFLHAKEVALLAGNMAAEMGLDVQMAKRMGLLHDIGKGLTHEQEGTHVELGWHLSKKCGEPDQVLNAIKAHHDEEPHRYPETFLVSAADAISGSRPGARREMFDIYVKRLEKLEEIAMSYPGVERSFAVQAGREIRIMVQPEAITDAEMARLSEEVARRIESELQYPGQIKVVVIRETRAIDFAR